MIQDSSIKDTVECMEIFLDTVDGLIGVFDGYDANDFCKGLVFGLKGANMLASVAETINSIERELRTLTQILVQKESTMLFQIRCKQ